MTDIAKKKRFIVEREKRKIGLSLLDKTNGDNFHSLWAQETNQYEDDLEEKNAQEINAMYEESYTLKLQEDSERQQKELKEARYKESQRFYNRPEAQADFDHWLKADWWTLNEAISLSFGHNPRIVTLKHLKSEESDSPLLVEYECLIDLATRRFDKQKVSPEKYIAWLKEKNIDSPLFHHSNKTKAQVNFTNYKSPYMQLMEDAISENNVTSKNQLKKETLINWFCENASPSLKMSRKKADMMATLIRLPESSKGGNKKVSG